MKNFTHIPVLLKEVIEGLNIEPGKKYVDATLGGGGHSSEMLQRGGMVLGIDQDEDALRFIQETQNSNIKSQKLKVVKGNFREIKDIAIANGFEKVAGILFDFGVSSYQLDESGRGFSFKSDEELDMRMDKNLKLTAFDVVNNYPKEKLEDIFLRYGEEHNALKIAQSIVLNRKKSEIRTTRQLSKLIEEINGVAGGIHPATRVFQAIRIEVNGEIEAIKSGLENSCSLLDHNGRIVAISFHSLEDRIVKQMFHDFQRKGIGRIVAKKPILPSSNEKNRNRRSRSAKLRIFEKI